MLLRQALAIDRLNAGEMHDRLATLGAAMIDEALQGLAGGTLSATPQPAEGVTYAEKIDTAEGHLDWREDAGALERRVRAFTPWPGALERESVVSWRGVAGRVELVGGGSLERQKM